MARLGTRQGPTLGGTLARKLLVLAASCAMFAVGFAYISIDGRSTSPQPAPDPVVRTTDAQRLIETHDCWSGEAPADMEGQIPGHVVVTLPESIRPVLGGDALVSKAFEQIFDGVGHDLTVHAFCR